MAELTLRAGSTVITPSDPGELAGYAARAGALSQGTHDDLEASLVVLDAGTTSIAWLALDAIGVTAALAGRLREAIAGALAAEHVVISASHTHSAPLGWTGSIHPGHAGTVDAAAVAELVERIGALAARVADEPATSVSAEWSAAEVEGVGTNRHDPSGPHERTLGMLRLIDRAGQPRAAIVDFATHPTVLGPDNLRWSADWPGALRTRLRETGIPVVLFLQGAAGDVSARFTRQAATFDEAHRLGAVAFGGTTGPAAPLEGRLIVATATVTLSRRDLPDRAAAEAAVGAAEERLRSAGSDPQSPAVRIAQTELDGARVQRDLVAAAPTGPVGLSLTVIALGDLAWVLLPVEPFASVGLRIAEASAFPVTRVIGYSDDYLGYLADEAAHRAGTYEALSSVFRHDAAGAVIAAALDLLASVRDRAPHHKGPAAVKGPAA